MISTKLAAVAALLLAAFLADAPNFTGHYELADPNSDRNITLDLTQTGNKVTVSFSAGMVDGSGAAPDGDGAGTVDKKSGVLKFTFTDSFNNECSGTLTREKIGYRLNITPTKVADPRPMRFYGDVEMKKTSAKPSSA